MTDTAYLLTLTVTRYFNKGQNTFSATHKTLHIFVSQFKGQHTIEINRLHFQQCFVST